MTHGRRSLSAYILLEKKKNIFGIYSFPKGLSIDSNQQYFPAFHQEHLNTHNIANSFLYDYQAQEKKNGDVAFFSGCQTTYCSWKSEILLFKEHDRDEAERVFSMATKVQLFIQQQI